MNTRQFLLYACLVLLSGVVFLFSDEGYVIDIAVLVVGAHGVGLKGIVKLFFIYTSIALIILMLLSLSGIIINYKIYGEYGGQLLARYSFGSTYPTDFAARIFYVELAYSYIRKKKHNFLYLIFWVAAGLFVWFFCRARLNTVLIICLSLAVYINSTFPKFYKYKTIKFVLIYGMIICCVISLLLHGLYSVDNSILFKLNGALSDRLRLGKIGIDEYGFSLFGKVIEMNGNGFTTKEIDWSKGYFFIDSGFLKIALTNGIAYLLLFIVIYTIAAKGAIKSGNIILGIIILFLALTSIVDHHIVEVGYNPFIFVITGVLLNLKSGYRRKSSNYYNREKVQKVVNKKPTKSIKKNYIYNLIYQIFVLIVPIIVTPYLSRVLGPEGTGQYSFTYSLTNYFTLLAALGFGYYAQREIANHQDDTKSKSLIFWEIIIVRLFSVGLSLAITVILSVTGVYGSYSSLMWWWIILIAAQGFDITFLLQGNEEFAKIAIRNVIVKLISVVCIFLFVKKSTDVYLYVIFFAASTLIGNLSLWFYLPKMLCKVKASDLKPLRHLIPTLRLFVPTVAIYVYAVLDKTLIGVLIPGTKTEIIDGVEVVTKISDLENGYYEQAEKIVKVCMTVVTALGTVMIPRNSNEFALGNVDKVKENVYAATNFVWLMGVPLALGLAAIADNMVPWFLGEGYDKCVPLMQVFTPLILIIGFSNVFGLQYLLPTQRDGKYTVAIVLGAVVNLALNIVGIKYFMSYGAVAASVMAEITVTAIMILLVRKEISFLKILKQSVKYLIAGGVMFAAVYCTQMFLKPSILFTFLLILEGAIVYFVGLLCLRDKYVLDVINKLLKRVKRKKTTTEISGETAPDVVETTTVNSDNHIKTEDDLG